MVIKKIELSEGCFGPDITIDDESLHLHEYDKRSEEYVNQLKLKLLTELIKNVNNLSLNDCVNIGEMIINNNNNWNLIEDESYENECEQCGNWNYTKKYLNIENE